MTESRKLEKACPDCGSDMELRNSRYGKFYGCVRFPACRSTHGAHKDGTPLGIPANKETRQARMDAHAAFDKVWHTNEARTGAYRWLRSKLGLSRGECHIGRFDIDMCKKVIELCNELEIDPPDPPEDRWDRDEP